MDKGTSKLPHVPSRGFTIKAALVKNRVHVNRSKCFNVGQHMEYILHGKSSMHQTSSLRNHLPKSQLSWIHTAKCKNTLVLLSNYSSQSTENKLKCMALQKLD
jgi:hypothetical protein